MKTIFLNSAFYWLTSLEKSRKTIFQPNQKRNNWRSSRVKQRVWKIWARPIGHWKTICTAFRFHHWISCKWTLIAFLFTQKNHRIGNAFEWFVFKLTLFNECFAVFNEFWNVVNLPNVDDVENPTSTQTQQKVRR